MQESEKKDIMNEKVIVNPEGALTPEKPDLPARNHDIGVTTTPYLGLASALVIE